MARPREEGAMIEPKKLSPDGQTPAGTPRRTSPFDPSPFVDRGQVVPLGITGEAVPPLTGPGPGVAQPYAPPAQQQAFPQQGYAPQGFPPPPAQPYAAPFHGYVPPPAYGAPPQPVAPPRPRHAVPRQRLVDAGMIVPDGGPTAQLEEFRIVKRQLLGQVEELRRMGSGAASQRIMISSPHPAEGKTFCAVNLAMSIAAEKEAEVVLVDLDLARSSALDILGIKNGPGLMDALVDPRIDVRRLVIPTDIHGLSVLPGGRPTNSDAEYLASSRAPRVLDMLTEGRRAASSSSIRRRPLPPCSRRGRQAGRAGGAGGAGRQDVEQCGAGCRLAAGGLSQHPVAAQCRPVQPERSPLRLLSWLSGVNAMSIAARGPLLSVVSIAALTMPGVAMAAAAAKQQAVTLAYDASLLQTAPSDQATPDPSAQVTMQTLPADTAQPAGSLANARSVYGTSTGNNPVSYHGEVQDNDPSSTNIATTRGSTARGNGRAVSGQQLDAGGDGGDLSQAQAPAAMLPGQFSAFGAQPVAGRRLVIRPISRPSRSPTTRSRPAAGVGC
jgi:hypothetical protein